MVQNRRKSGGPGDGEARSEGVFFRHGLGSRSTRIVVNSARLRITTGIPGYQRDFDVTPELAQKADGLLIAGKTLIAVVRDGRVVVEIREG